MRTKAEVNQDYTNKCALLGDAYFRLNALIPEKMQELMNQIMALSKEADDVAKNSLVAHEEPKKTVKIKK